MTNENWLKSEPWSDQDGQGLKVWLAPEEGQQFTQADADAALYQSMAITWDGRDTTATVIKAEAKPDGSALILTCSIV
jgi:hypothetical protein